MKQTIMLLNVFFSLLLVPTVSAIAAEPADSVAADSIAARNLREVTVTAKNVYKVTDGYAFVPSKTVKKTSFDVKQMISRVPLSNVIVGFDGEITDIKKNEAKYFIDSKPVSQEEVKALLNKDVERIEFLNNPSDGAFLGEKFAINIVTRQTVYGGYMTVSAGQRFFQPYGSYYLSGKFVGSEKWSLMAIGGYNYSKETGSHGTQTIKYDLEDHVTGEMVHVDRISQKTGSLMRHNSWSGAVSGATRLRGTVSCLLQRAYLRRARPTTTTTAFLIMTMALRAQHTAEYPRAERNILILQHIGRRILPMV